jgi:hypothetical protein
MFSFAGTHENRPLNFVLLNKSTAHANKQGFMQLLDLAAGFFNPIVLCRKIDSLGVRILLVIRQAIFKIF